MKRIPFLLLIIVLFINSLVSGYLMSKASWIGRVGMTFFYKEYNFLKIWWQGAGFVFIMYTLILLLHYTCYKKLSISKGRMIYLLSFLMAAGLIYYSYYDFHHDLTHRLMRHRFHNGVYLFWAGWMLIAIFFFVSGKGKIKIQVEKAKI